MAAIRIKRVPGTRDFVATESRCDSCVGCEPSKPKLMLIDTADELSISLSAAVQRSLLWNSLGKPVAALLIAVLLCQLAGLGEAMTLCMAICGFICGVLTCRTLPETSLEKISVN